MSSALDKVLLIQTNTSCSSTITLLNAQHEEVLCGAFEMGGLRVTLQLKPTISLHNSGNYL